ncbi:hypothetical protein EDD22DRAFT_1021548 [Suillus occidentalis]|nr:hypothetical protein EDD22DRAFT_1021548 [Suillus occidentalis]
MSRIPKLVRGVTMGEFADTYNGDIQACLRGLVGGSHVPPGKSVAPSVFPPSARKNRLPSEHLHLNCALHPRSEFHLRLENRCSGMPPFQAKRPPTSATFAPALPTKTPTYPTLRAPRRDESMLSLNGSPLANPFKLGLEWFATEEEEEEGIYDMDVKTKGKGKEAQARSDTQGEGKTLRRVNSIVIRRDPSVSLVPSSSTQTGRDRNALWRE